jgi:hypothetical protein
MFHGKTDSLFITEPHPGIQGILDMGFGRVMVFVEHGRDAALGIVSAAGIQGALAEDGHPGLGGQMQTEAETGCAATDYEYIMGVYGHRSLKLLVK